MDIKQAIQDSKNIYPDVIEKSMPVFETTFADQIAEWKQEFEVDLERLSDEIS